MLKAVLNFIPNLITLMNLVAGLASIYFALVLNDYETAAKLIFLGAIFDFFDGFAARALNASSAIGKELDSLSDLVTFALAPTAILVAFYHDSSYLWAFAVIPVASALRLAKFNTDTRQQKVFIGMPTPALAFFVSASVLSGEIFHVDFKIALIISFVLSFMLLAPVKMFSFKFKNGFSLRDNYLIYLFMLLTFALFLFFRINSLLLIFALYIFFSVLINFKH